LLNISRVFFLPGTHREYARKNFLFYASRTRVCTYFLPRCAKTT
jgi:hypothetical protein